MKKLILFVLAVISVTGCTKLKHLPQLLTLKSYSEEQESIEDYVHVQDDLFTQMIADIESGEFQNYTTKEQIIGKYGDPIYDREEEYQGAVVDKVLYRRQKEFFGSDKVYLYFDKQGQILNTEFLPGEKEEDNE